MGESLYQMGIDAGAWGGKLLGSGAGGFMLFFAPPEVHHNLQKVQIIKFYKLKLMPLILKSFYEKMI